MTDTAMPGHAEPPIDQRRALSTAAGRLHQDFAGVHDQDTIDRVLRSNYCRFAASSTIAPYLPLLAERFARQRLSTQATPDHATPDGRPVVLFLCVHNAGRSQMALGFLTHLAGGKAIGWSGGSEPADEINPAAIAAMAERGIDINGQYPKPWTDEVIRGADVVITMGCGDTCPYFPGIRYQDWGLDDAAGKTLAEVRPIRDEIERRVRRLLAEFGVPGRS